MKVFLKIAVILLLFPGVLSAQKKDKIKGSKNITITSHDLEAFTKIEVDADYDVMLLKADKPSIEIEADNNLHETISYQVSGNTLKISLITAFTGAKKFLVKVNYAEPLKSIIAKKESNITSVSELDAEDILVKVYDNARTNLKIKTKTATLQLSDKSKSEIAIKADSLELELNNSAQLKGILNTPGLKIDLRQNSDAILEGNVKYASLKLINNANISSKKLNITHLDLITESSSKCSTNVSNLINISASGKSEIELLGNPQIVMKQFSNNAALTKKEK